MDTCFQYFTVCYTQEYHCSKWSCKHEDFIRRKGSHSNTPVNGWKATDRYRTKGRRSCSSFCSNNFILCSFMASKFSQKALNSGRGMRGITWKNVHSKGFIKVKKISYHIFTVGPFFSFSSVRHLYMYSRLYEIIAQPQYHIVMFHL